ncbi:MAG: hypothetical protein OEX02_19295 [Cyclobacteriaceae bacterium]|nr:hypothetical protein [Cyclobacteriaceae bacterium]
MKNKKDNPDEKAIKRREFIKSSTRSGLLLGLGGLGGLLATNSQAENYVWQIDSFECTNCGRCAEDCVETPSAVKCIHAFDLCGYCDLCGGYFKPGTLDLTTGAEAQICPTSAIKRSFVEDPFFEHTIDEDLCIGCAICVEGCAAFGNGSLQIQIKHDLCVDCNQCSIARVCPADAIKRVPASKAYNIKDEFLKNKA